MDKFIIAVIDLKEELEKLTSVFRFELDDHGEVLSVYDTQYEEGFPFLTLALRYHQIAFYTYRITDANRKVAFIIHNRVKDINYEYMRLPEEDVL